MTALTGTAAEDVKTADNILADKMAEVRAGSVQRKREKGKGRTLHAR